VSARPTLDRDVAVEYLRAYDLYLADHPVIVLGVRGAKGKNRIGIFDDVIATVTGARCDAFTANTDPSSDIAGRAHLTAGIWMFKIGEHHPGTPKAYPAFVQGEPFVVHRFDTEDVPEGTKDVRGECLGDGLWRGLFHINIHNAMGVNTTGSEGCQTIIKDQWAAFHDPTLADLKAAGITEFPYVLVEKDV
jgi:hypothetical protein